MNYFFKISDDEVDKLMGSASPKHARQWTPRINFVKLIAKSVNNSSEVSRSDNEWVVKAPNHGDIKAIFNLTVNRHGAHYIFSVETTNIQEILRWLDKHVEPDGYQFGSWFGQDLSVLIVDKEKASQFKLSIEGVKDGSQFR